MTMNYDPTMWNLNHLPRLTKSKKYNKTTFPTVSEKYRTRVCVYIYVYKNFRKHNISLKNLITDCYASAAD